MRHPQFGLVERSQNHKNQKGGPPALEFISDLLIGSMQYDFPLRTLQPGETAMFDLRNIKNQSVKDVSGHLIPPDAQTGKFHWRLVNNNQGRLIGREEVSSVKQHRASSFSCGDACGGFDGPYVSWADPERVPGESVNLTVTCDNCQAYADFTNVYPSVCSFTEDNDGDVTVTMHTAGTCELDYPFSEDQTVWDGQDCIDEGYNEWTDSVTFDVNDPSPTITSVSPGSWNAGTTTPIRVTGTGFGTAPTLTITDPAGAIIGLSVSGASDSEIDATVNIAGTAPAENATVTVTSQGYNGQGFISNQGNSSTSPSVNVPINPANVGISGPLGIVNGTSTGFSISDPNNLSLNLSLSFSGSGKATFGAQGGTSTSVNGSGTVTVSGSAISSTANDVLLTVKDQFGNTLGSTQFSVIWVTLSMRISGKITDDTDDDVSSRYSSANGTSELEAFAVGKNGVVFKGAVAPSNFIDAIHLKRAIVSTATYADTGNGQTLSPNQVSSTGSYTCGSVDLTLCFDDSGTVGVHTDNTPPPNGNLYDWDVPGIDTVDLPQTPNYVSRQRVNFEEYASYNGKRASDLFAWYNRSSACVLKNQDGSFIVTFCSNLSPSRAVTGDDQAGAGSTNTSWNLN